MTDGGESAAVSFFGVSDVGLVRKSNEDAFGVFGAGGAHLGEAGRVAGGGDLIAVVSDGVGGHDAGEVASAAAVASLGAGLGQLAVGGVAEEAVPGALRGLLDGLNRHLRSFSKNRGQEKRMAATATAAWLGRGRLVVAHVGDSRVYRWRGGRLTCLTVDDTEAARAVAEGRITPEQARTHAKKHVLERAVGMDPQKFASSAEIHAVEDGDVYLLCSDGLTDGLSDQQLERGFEGLDPGDLAAFAERLVEAGNRASGKDNLTAVLLAVGPGWVKASRRAAPPPTPVSASRLSTLSGDSIMQAFSRSAWPLWGAVGILFLTMLGLTWQDRRARADLVATIAGLQGVIQQADAPSVGDPPLGDSVDSVADTPPEGATPTETTALASPAEAGAPQPPSVLLRIDPADAGARVWLGPEADVAVGADGVLRFEAFPLGKHELLVQAPGYQPVVTRVEVGPAGLEETVRLVAVRGAVEIVTSPGALVVAVDERGGETRLGEADRTGRLLSENVLRIGSYRLRLSAENRASAEVPVELMIGRTIRLERALAPLPGELRVLTVPSGATVEARAGDWSVRGETPATLRGVPTEAEVLLAVSLRGYRTERRTLTLDPAEVRTVNIGTLVAEAGGVEFRLQNEELRRGAGVVVKVDGREQSGAWRDGVLRLEGLEVGRHALEVTHPSYVSHSSHFTITDQRTSTHEVRLAPLPGRITLDVSGPRAGEWSVEVGGEAMRPASGNVLELAAQREHVVRVSARGWQAAEQRVTLGAGEQRRLSFRLEEARGPVPGQNAEVELPGGVKVELVWIRPGEFTMGSPGNEAGRESQEGPQTRVRLTRGFWLGKYPVTQGQWQALMENNPSRFTDSGLNAPVEQVSWNEAMEFARRLTEQERRAGRLAEGYVYTLPSEAQWEYACRAGTTTRFNLGDNDSDLGRAGWFSGNSGNRAHAVGQKTSNAWGLYDMHGNVWEWTRSWYGSYPGGSVVDYEGPESGVGRTCRGGSWNAPARDCRSAGRGSGPPDGRNTGIGFRLALAPVP